VTAVKVSVSAKNSSLGASFRMTAVGNMIRTPDS
jgi:hypothetical protein